MTGNVKQTVSLRIRGLIADGAIEGPQTNSWRYDRSHDTVRNDKSLTSAVLYNIGSLLIPLKAPNCCLIYEAQT